MTEKLDILLNRNKSKCLKSIQLVEDSLKRVVPYDSAIDYNSEQLEPYDALSSRFTRAVEQSIKYFRTFEKTHFAENAETIRDLFNRMEKVELISSTDLWMEMRDVRNRIVHDYLPEETEEIFNSIINSYSNELVNLKNQIENK